MLEHIKNIVYTKELMPTYINEYFELQICENMNILKYSNNGSIKQVNINNKLVVQYIDKLFRIIDDWKNEYINNNDIDGIEWKLQITYLDERIECYKGKNDFPKNFEYLDRIKNEIIMVIKI